MCSQRKCKMKNCGQLFASYGWKAFLEQIRKTRYYAYWSLWSLNCVIFFVLCYHFIDRFLPLFDFISSWNSFFGNGRVMIGFILFVLLYFLSCGVEFMAVATSTSSRSSVVQSMSDTTLSCRTRSIWQFTYYLSVICL